MGRPCPPLLAAALMLSAGAAAAQSPAPCRDDSAEAAAAYDSSLSRGAGGPILRLEYKPDHTLLVILGPGEQEICAILPPKAELQRRKVDLASLAPGKYAMVNGFRHRTDEQRLWAYGLQPAPGVRGVELRPD